jgi:fatty-acyl-CoA synthase
MHDDARADPHASPTTGGRLAPTLKHAIAALATDADRGFVFVRADGSERFCSFHEIHAETTRRGARLAEQGLEKGDRLALVIPDGDEFVLSFLAAIVAGIVPVPMYPQLSFRNVESYHDSDAAVCRPGARKGRHLGRRDDRRRSRGSA